MVVGPEYIAAFLDGEGTVGINRSRPSPDGSHTYRQLKVGLFNNDREILEEISESIQLVTGIPRGLYVFEHTENDAPGAVRNHTNYRISYTGKKAMRFLRWIRPYLRVKRRQADLAITFQKHKKHVGGRPAPLRRWRIVTRLRKQGHSHQEIAEAIGMSLSTVRRDLLSETAGVVSQEDYFAFEKACHEKMMKLNRHPRGCDGTCRRPP